MTTSIGNIFLAWRKGPGHRRILLGRIHRDASGVSFSYIPNGIIEAKSQGCILYPDFPDENKTYTQNVLEIFAQRLNKSEREDIKDYYTYWEIEPSLKDDKYYLLAHTQGLLPTDNFEFLADYNPTQGLSFVSELCGLSILALESSALTEGDCLTWEKEPSNSFDKHAVKVFKGHLFVGYVKRIHSGLFYKKTSGKINITVKSVHKNGHINRAFIKISVL